MTLQKNVKSHVFLDFEKNVKNVFSNYDSSHKPKALDTKVNVKASKPRPKIWS